MMEPGSTGRGGAPQATRAIVLRTYKHTDGRVIARMCTERHGTRGVLVRTGKGNAANAALQALTRLEVVVLVREGQELLFARDLRVELPYRNLGQDPLRGALALFMQELLVRLLHEEVADPRLFATLQDLLEEMDSGADPAGHPLRAMVALLAHMGIRPEPPAGPVSGFDLREGAFCTAAPLHELCMPGDRAQVLAALLAGGAPDLGATVPHAVRRALLDDLLLYFRLHVEGFGELRSPEVLRQVLG